MNKIFSLLCLLMITLSGCSKTIQAETVSDINNSEPLSYWASYKGDRRNIIHHGDLSAQVDLNSLAGVTNLYAIGPVTGLQGEITIYNGVPSISTVVDGLPKVDVSFNYGAVFLAYSKAPTWQVIPVAQRLSGLDEIERFVKTSARQAGVSLDKPFPFRIEGTVDSLEYHIIYKTNHVPHNKKEHKKSKRKFFLEDTTVEIIGFWAGQEGEGVFTHPGKMTHLHFLTPDNSTSGHVDGILIPGGAILYLPK